MLVRIIGFGLCVSLVCTAYANSSWLINPSVNNSAAIEIHSKESEGRVWRLVLRDKTLVAEMRQPIVPKGFEFNYGQCKIAGVIRDDLIAVVKHNPKVEWSEQVLDAWFADVAGRKFVHHYPVGMTCRNEGFGL